MTAPSIVQRIGKLLFEGLIRRWFNDENDSYSDFVDTLLSNDIWAVSNS